MNFTVGSTGLTSSTGTSYNLNRFGCFKLRGNRAYAWQGGVASVSSSGVASQVGSFTLPATNIYSGGGNAIVAPDASIGQDSSLAARLFPAMVRRMVFCPTTPATTCEMPCCRSTYPPSKDFPATQRWTLCAGDRTGWQCSPRRGTSTSYVVRSLCLSCSTATRLLVISSYSTLTHGSGNTLLTLTGSNFVPGVAVTWNGEAIGRRRSRTPPT